MLPKVPPPSQKKDDLRSLTRLLIGGSVTGIETLVRQMRAWEEELEFLRTQPPPPVNSETDEKPFEFSRPHGAETYNDLLRYAFIGWLMENETRAARRFGQMERISRGLWRIAEPWAQPFLRPLQKSRTLTILRRRYAGFQARGEDEIERWIALGRREEHHSRDLARLALKRTVDQNIAYLAHNPEVEQLVETQSSGLANEVVEEVRERTVSADTFLEGLARSILRRPPRAALPEPPESVRKLAEGLRSPKKPSRGP